MPSAKFLYILTLRRFPMTIQRRVTDALASLLRPSQLSTSRLVRTSCCRREGCFIIGQKATKQPRAHTTYSLDGAIYKRIPVSPPLQLAISPRCAARMQLRRQYSRTSDKTYKYKMPVLANDCCDIFYYISSQLFILCGQLLQCRHTCQRGYRHESRRYHSPVPAIVIAR